MITLNVNGVSREIDADPDMPLLWALRDLFKLTGTKYGCGIGECGTCTVQVNGKAERSCSISVGDVQGKAITTIEGLPANHPVKKAWIQEQVVQCGYCQPGIIMQVASLLEAEKNPTADKIISRMDDVICRCGSYPRIKKGIQTAIQISGKEGRKS